MFTHAHTRVCTHARTHGWRSMRARNTEESALRSRGRTRGGEGTNKTRLRRQLVVSPSGQTTNPHDARARIFVRPTHTHTHTHAGEARILIVPANQYTSSFCNFRIRQIQGTRVEGYIDDRCISVGRERVSRTFGDKYRASVNLQASRVHIEREKKTEERESRIGVAQIWPHELPSRIG